EDGIRYFHVTGVQTCALPIFPLDERPHSEPLEDAPAAVRQRGRAVVEAGVINDIERSRFDEDDVEIELRQRKRQAGAYQTAAGDCDAAAQRAHAALASLAPIGLSIPSGRFARAAVRAPQPSDGTTTPPPLRTPMVHQPLGP